MDDRDQPPASGHSLEFVFAEVVELDGRPDDEILHGARNEDLPSTGESPDTGSDVDCEAPEIVTPYLALAGVDADAYLDPEFTCRGTDRFAAANPRAGPSKEARKPSPVVLISLPRNTRSCSRIRASCASRSRCHRWSPIAAAVSVEPTMSVKITVASTRFDRDRWSFAG